MNEEQKIEFGLLEKLKELNYTYRSDIIDRDSLEANFRQKFEELNRVSLSDAEFERLYDSIIGDDTFEIAKRLRERHNFIREDGTPLNYTLVNIKDWCKNDYEVINQLRINTRNSHHRYDVIILINGLPVVQIELKNYTVNPRKAMQQIVDYKNDPGNGYSNTLLCFMQLFIVSNESRTLYFANNKNCHFNFDADEQFLPVYNLADKNNNKINHLHDFANNFLPKCTLGQMISKYMVLVATEQRILVMRPYQVFAVKAIVDCINNNLGNGYIWHTTGSGKTLTSFKAATLLKNNSDIEKCLFVVDRKDLDRQTREEFNKFQDGCVEENTNTYTLVQRLLSEDYADKVIVTTIQKLGLALDENSRRNKNRAKKGKQRYTELLQPLSDKRVAIIFDECHRSQFGDNHKAIKEFFPKSQLFGFTGTPIFESNAMQKRIDGTIESYNTTEDIFQKELHNYTITHAIEDKNVLSFHIDYFNESKEQVPKNVIVEKIIEKHDSATSQSKFNALFATASINDAIKYYRLFKELQAQEQSKDENYRPLNIACVFSPPVMPNDDKKNQADAKQLQEDLLQEREDNKVNPAEKKAALTEIIADYNQQYGPSHTISEFDKYYQDVQKRIKDHKYSNQDYPHKNKIDICIVVDMLLTGFDSKYLNTLYVDKNLKYHGLIQALSRTNRVLNDSKPWGNILDFRGQEDEVNTAIALFSGKSEKAAKEIWLADSAPVVIEKYEKALRDLGYFMEDHNLVCEPSAAYNIKGDSSRIDFVNRFKEVQKIKTKLDQYTGLSKEQKDKIEKLLPKRDLEAFRISYLETAKKLKQIQQKEGDDAPKEIQELDFELVLFASALIDYDYIMGLIAKFSQTQSSKQKMTRQQLINLLSASANLQDEKEDITEYINTLKEGEGLTEQQIRDGCQHFKNEKQIAETNNIANKHSIPTEDLHAFINSIMSRMIFDGEQLTDLLAPLNLGWKKRRVKELAFMEDLTPLLNKRAKGREISGLEAYE